MTSDAKVGLLLGLVFIFIIAFIINGLPHFNRTTNSNELTTLGNSANQNLTIAGNQRQQAARITPLSPRRNRTHRVVAETPAQLTTQINNEQPITKGDTSQTTRFEISLPQAPIVAEQTTLVQPTGRLERIKKTMSKIYTVRSGDSLSKIALLCYGPVEGNRYVNINRIFEANNRALKSPDKVYEGMKLNIPPLPDTAQTQEIFHSTTFEKVETISPAIIKNKVTIKKQALKQVVVNKGDSLWKIATKYLGNGNRYKEIIKLNSKSLPDEDHLIVGMKLTLPEK